MDEIYLSISILISFGPLSVKDILLQSHLVEDLKHLNKRQGDLNGTRTVANAPLISGVNDYSQVVRSLKHVSFLTENSLPMV